MNKFNKTLLSSSIALVLGFGLQTQVLAEEDTPPKSEDEVIVVTGIRGSLKENINKKRFSDTVSDVITAEDVGKFPDKNVAETLSRITGVGISREFGEGEKITIRGTDATQNRTLLNGQNVGTADWFILDQPSRGFNFTLLPSSLVKSLAVYKSPEAKIDEGSLGGSVVLNTRRPLELESGTIKLGLQSQYSETSEKHDPQIDGLFSWKNEDETFGLLVSLTKQDRTVQREGLEVLGWTPADANGIRAPKDIGNPIFRQSRERETVFASLQFIPSADVDVTLNILDSKMDANNANSNLLIRPQNNYADLINTAMDGNNIVAATVASAGAYEWDFINRESSTDTSSYDLDINYDGDGYTFHAQVGTTEAAGGTYNETSWSFIPNIDPSLTGYSFDLRGTPTVNIGVDPTDGSQWGQNWTWGGNKPTTDEETYAQFDVEMDLDHDTFETLEFGVKLRDHDRTQGRQAYSWHGPGTRDSYTGWGGYMGYIFEQCPTLADCGQSNGVISVAGNVVNGNVVNQLQGDREQFMRLGFAGEADYAISNSLGEIWAINESILAAYVQANFKSDNYRGNVGLRFVKTDQDASSYNFSPDSWGFHTVDRDWLTPSYMEWVTEDRSYTEILPSFNLAYDLDDERILRFAVARVMSRPNFSDLAPGVALGDLNGANPTATGGNPNLSPTIANQFDVSYEWYFDDAAILSATLFYKDIESYRSTTSYVGEFYNESTEEYVDVTVFIPSNGEGGSTTGLELGYMQQFGEFGVSANYTYTNADHDGDEDVMGASDHMLNASVFYETDEFGARLMYNYRTEWYVGPNWTGAELWTDSYGQLDFSASYRLNDNIDLVFEAVNLTDEEVVQFDGEPERLMSIYQNGRRFVIGVNATF